ncbi:uncharacterized protein ELE39_003356 [Cryptosporidium sp. chipmunk genotype I]|uniref:uncharacterized protein n=1 Tax=Cryptosporidium sp. chipmunk genotype I TaxID=1280935 RepID=UPI00351A4277|nr:hypothetical protein ELE39_003356 [Cryptosporidium sp. chipmunk genotype I]
MNRTKLIDKVLISYIILNIFLFNLSFVISKNALSFNNNNNTYSLKITRRKLSRNHPKNNTQDSEFSTSSNSILRKLLINEDTSKTIINGDLENDSNLQNFTIISENGINTEDYLDFKNHTNDESSIIVFSAGKSVAKTPKKAPKNTKTVSSVTTKTTSTSTIFTITNSTTITTTTTNGNSSTTQVITETHNVRRVQNKNEQGLPKSKNNETKGNTQVNEESITNDMAQDKEDFTQIFNVIQDPEWITSNGDYYIIEFTEQNSTVPLVRLINLSVGLYNKNGNIEEAKRLISAILGSRNLGDPDDEQDTEESDNYFGSGLFNLDDIINWDDLDFMDEMPSLFRKLNNIIWL